MPDDENSGENLGEKAKDIISNLSPAWYFPAVGCVLLIIFIVILIAIFAAAFSRSVGEESSLGGGIGSCETVDTITLSGVAYKIPATSGKISHEDHLATSSETFSCGQFPCSTIDGIQNHLNITNFSTNCSGCSAGQWTPAEGGGRVGQGRGFKPPISTEPWVMNMRFKPMPPAGTRVIITATKTGESVVAAAGYEYGPSERTGNIAGAQIEVLHNLGIGHGGEVTIGFATDQAVPYGPIECQATGGAASGVGCNNVPIFRQCDSRWGWKIYGTGTICTSACGPTSAAMVLKFYGKNVDPPTIASQSVAGGFRVPFQGTSPGLFPWIARRYGLRGSGEFGWSRAKQYLLQGKPVIARMRGPSMFTSGGGHYIVLTGINPDGTICINDPGPRKKTQATENQVRSYLKGASIIEP